VIGTAYALTVMIGWAWASKDGRMTPMIAIVIGMLIVFIILAVVNVS